jgi:FtsP/CotA-like multicopper oxidase with cupredoxin domain
MLHRLKNLSLDVMIMLQKRIMKEMFPYRGKWIMMMAFLIMIILFALPAIAYDTPPGTIDPTTIQQFENVLTGAPPVWVPYHSDSAKDQYVINMSQFNQRILPVSMGKTTTVWGYGGQAKDAVTGAPLGFVRNAPAGTFEAQKGKRVEVKWVNDLTGPHLYAVDPTLHWANASPNCMLMDMIGTFPGYPPGFIGTNNEFGCNAQSPVPTVVHLHGAEVLSTSDGGPDQWFTANGIHGKDYFTSKKTDSNAAIYEYPNTQPPTTLFYHDHALGITRLNVFSGLVGFYLLRDPGKEPSLIADKKYEIPLAIQDRIFKENGDFYFYPEGNVPELHPYWVPEYFGNAIMVNGLVWPKMDVDQTTYRLRLVDGSNARFYTLHFMDSDKNPVQFYQIGTDGGYLPHPVPLYELTISPGERADILINFTGVNGPVTLTNDAKFPFPAGDDPEPGVDGTIMRFDIGSKVVLSPPLPATINSNIPDLSLATPSKTRIRTLVEIANADDKPVMVTLNGQRWMGALSETPAPGAIEDWVIVDTTMDTHPIHTHLTQFQLQSRQNIDTATYLNDWVHKQWTTCANFGLSPCGTLEPGTLPPWPNNYIPLELPIGPYLQPGTLTLPADNEKGWKDTIQMNPDQVTIIRIRYQALDNSGHAPNWYDFDPTIGQGYVWHCHIIDHEDNEMMRPYKVVRTSPPGRVIKK